MTTEDRATARRLAVLAPRSVPPDAIAARLPFELRASDRIALLSNMGTHFDVDSASGGPAHMFSGLDRRFDRAVILKEFPILYASEFVLCWLASLVGDMGPGGSLWIEIESDAANARRGQVSGDLLMRRFPRASIEREGRWVRLAHWSGIVEDIAAMATIYRRFHGAADKFVEVFADDPEKAGQDPAAIRSDAIRWYIYSLFGAAQKSFAYQRIIADTVGARPVEGLDLGGGCGFLAAELAAAGNKMTVLDLKPRHIEVGRWLARFAGVDERMSFGVSAIEDIGSVSGAFDVASYFGCLLYARRASVPDVLRETMRRLRPGGVLLIHENPKGVIKPGGVDYDVCFERGELLDLLRAHAGEPAFYNMFTGNPMRWDETEGKVLMAAVRKA